jgi:hypothetical protein
VSLTDLKPDQTILIAFLDLALPPNLRLVRPVVFLYQLLLASTKLCHQYMSLVSTATTLTSRNLESACIVDVLEVLWHAEIDKEPLGTVQRGLLGVASDAPASASLKAANVPSQKSSSVYALGDDARDSWSSYRGSSYRQGSHKHDKVCLLVCNVLLTSPSFSLMSSLIFFSPKSEGYRFQCHQRRSGID